MYKKRKDRSSMPPPEAFSAGGDGDEEVIGEVDQDNRRIHEDGADEQTDDWMPRKTRTPNNNNANNPEGKKDDDERKIAAALVNATRQGDRPAVDEILSKQRQPKIIVNQDVCGSSPLMYAAFYGRTELVTLFVESGGDINKRNVAGITALNWAIEQGHLETVKEILKLGAEVDQPDSAGFTALHKAVRTNSLPLVKILLEDGKADPSLVSQDGSSVLGEAAAHGQSDIVSYLLHTTEVDLDHKDKQGRTALHRAAMKNRESCVQLLIDAGADLNIVDGLKRTALHWAAFYKAAKVAVLLANSSAELLIMKDKYGHIPADVARNRGEIALQLELMRIHDPNSTLVEVIQEGPTAQTAPPKNSQKSGERTAKQQSKTMDKSKELESNDPQDDITRQTRSQTTHGPRIKLSTQPISIITPSPPHKQRQEQQQTQQQEEEQRNHFSNDDDDEESAESNNEDDQDSDYVADTPVQKRTKSKRKAKKPSVSTVELPSTTIQV